MEDKFDIKEFAAGIVFFVAVFGIGYAMKSRAKPISTKMVRKVEQGKLEKSLSRDKRVVELNLGYGYDGQVSKTVYNQTKHIKEVLEKEGYEVILARKGKSSVADESNINLYVNLPCNNSPPVRPMRIDYRNALARVTKIEDSKGIFPLTRNFTKVLLRQNSYK